MEAAAAAAAWEASHFPWQCRFAALSARRLQPQEPRQQRAKVFKSGLFDLGPCLRCHAMLGSLVLTRSSGFIGFGLCARRAVCCAGRRSTGRPRDPVCRLPMLTHLTSFLNHGELPVAALAYSKKQDLLLVCDGRYLRLYSSRDGYRCVRAVQLPPTVRRSRTPTTVVLLSRLLHSP